MDLMLFVSVFIVLVLTTLYVWFSLSVKSIWSIFRKTSPTRPVEGVQWSPQARQRATDNDPSGLEQTHGQSVKGATLERGSSAVDVDAPPGKGTSGSSFVSNQQSGEVQQSTAVYPSLAPLPEENDTDCIKCCFTLQMISRIVVPKVSSRWNYVGLQLGMSHECLRVIEREQPNNMEDCCMAMFSKWLLKVSGTGNGQRSWESVLFAVKIACGEAAKEAIMKELAKVAAQHDHHVSEYDDKPLRTKLKPYYSKECIQDNPLLASSTMQYVKVNLVQTKQRRLVAQRVGEAVAVHLAKGGVEQVPHEQVQVDYKAIFSFPLPHGISRKRVLVEGVPGSGKSTLVLRMCHDWSVGNFAQDYHVVIQVILRSLPRDQKLSLEDLIFTSISTKGVVQDISSFVLDHDGREVLFIFDGFDEMPDGMREKSVVHDIIAGRLAPQSSFLVTTRPISVESLYQYVDRRVQICGFGEEEVEKYIIAYFAFNPSAGETLLLALSHRPHIERLCYVPLLLQMICYTASLGGDLPELPSTLHQLFQSLIFLTINHNLERVGRKERIVSLQEIWKLCPSFDKLTELALIGIEEDKIIFPNLDFEVDSAFHGLFSCIEARNQFGAITSTWHFLHLVLQEFMATLALAKRSRREQVTFWRRHLTLMYSKYGNYVLADNRYHTMFLLYCGLSGLDIASMRNVLLDTLGTVLEPRISSSTSLPALCEAVAESRNEQLVQYILSPCGPTVEIEEDYLKNGGIAWCVAHYCKKVDGVGIRISGSGISNFLSLLGDTSTLVRVELPRMDTSDLPAVKQFLLKQVQLKCFTFGQYKITDERIQTMKDVLAHHRETLEEVTIHAMYKEVPFDSLVESLVTCRKLTSLELRDVTLSLQSFLTIMKALRSLKALNLETVSLSDEEAISTSAVNPVVLSVADHHSLTELTVNRCGASLTGAVEGMARRQGVEKLAVTQNEEMVNAVPLVQSVCTVMKTGSLKALGIGLTSQLAEQVMKELPCCTRLVELELVLLESDEVTTFPPVLTSGLSKCNTLQKLTVWGWNEFSIPPSVTAALLKAVRTIRSLTEVSLNSCDYEGVDETVISCLQESRVKNLEMTDCVNLSTVCIAAACEGLRTNPNLEQLIVRTCSEADEMTGEDVSDPHMAAVKAAVMQNVLVKKIVIDGSRVRWTNVAVAIIEGAQQNTTLRELKLETPEDPRLQKMVNELRKAKPKLQLVVRTGDSNIYDSFTYL